MAAAQPLPPGVSETPERRGWAAARPVIGGGPPCQWGRRAHLPTTMHVSISKVDQSRRREPEQERGAGVEGAEADQEVTLTHEDIIALVHLIDQEETESIIEEIENLDEDIEVHLALHLDHPLHHVAPIDELSLFTSI